MTSCLVHRPGVAVTSTPWCSAAPPIINSQLVGRANAERLRRQRGRCQCGYIRRHRASFHLTGRRHLSRVVRGQQCRHRGMQEPAWLVTSISILSLGRCASARPCLRDVCFNPHVCFGSKADICAATSHVRFTPSSESGHAANGHVCFTPKSGHVRCN